LTFHSSNNTISGNRLEGNGYGIYLTISAFWNQIFYNALEKNNVNAYDRSPNNRWDNGTTGNYYSDLGRIYYIPGSSGVDSIP
jgi:parallel beta-helix repeat protein